MATWSRKIGRPIITIQRVNREWFDHQRREQERDNSARAALDEHIKNTERAPVDPAAAREDLKRQFKETAREVTGRENRPPDGPDRAHARELPSGPDGPDRPSPGAAAAGILKHPAPH
jgi:hypothetical protein